MVHREGHRHPALQTHPSLSEEEIARIARWVDSGAPRGNPADMPPPRVFAGANEWEIGTPDFILKTPTLSMKAGAPDWWGALEPIATGLSEERYVSAIQVKEFTANGMPATGGKFIFHQRAHDDNWSLTSLQQRLVKTGGRLIKHARYYWLLPAESHLTRRLFGAMLRRIWALPVPTG